MLWKPFCPKSLKLLKFPLYSYKNRKKTFPLKRNFLMLKLKLNDELMLITLLVYHYSPTVSLETNSILWYACIEVLSFTCMETLFMALCN